MVDGLAAFNRRWGRMPAAVRRAVQEAMETGARETVEAMNGRTPIPEIIVAWTWGNAPAGSVTLAAADAPDSVGDLRITIYATAVIGSGSFPAIARWFEFGTSERHKKTGQYTGRITASPFFYPTWRSYQRRVKSRLSRAMGKAIRSL
ncbi:HK97 gp10 family phage protein [Martelella alba]|uniref:HK97 gp10 family phage protein n=1 Tax=Martelella alba TaxID=2590451 RepID=A0A506U7M1_9HYPH|nr:HK97 gp10 family phage protein [Martelella alba]TPW28609.1 HK97 gp10 family phage protein [Martelella alba]